MRVQCWCSTISRSTWQFFLRLTNENSFSSELADLPKDSNGDIPIMWPLCCHGSHVLVMIKINYVFHCMKVWYFNMRVSKILSDPFPECLGVSFQQTFESLYFRPTIFHYHQHYMLHELQRMTIEKKNIVFIDKFIYCADGNNCNFTLGKYF